MIMKRNQDGRRPKKKVHTSPITDQDEAQSLIELRQVVKTYHTPAGDFTALQGIDLTAEPGEFVAIVGKSGSGKSTLINMISGIDQPTSGEVWVNRKAVHALGQSEMAKWRGRNLGVVFQFFQLLPTLTVAQNVMLPMDFCNTYPVRERRDRAMLLLEQMEVADQADKLPSAISGGQQQRVAIARSVANDPPILLADEPTGNLDSATAEVIFKMFKRQTYEGKTVLMVTHDEDLASRVSRTLTVVDGLIFNDDGRQKESEETIKRPA
jgi:putative ABC transport system ATP-binding protein